MNGRVAVFAVGLCLVCSACDDQPEDGRVTKQEVKDTVSPKADAGLKGAKTGLETVGVQTMDAVEVAQHPGQYHGQTLRSTMKLAVPPVGEPGVAMFAADESRRHTLGLRVPQAMQTRLAEMAKGKGDAQGSQAGSAWLTVTYTLDQKVEQGASSVGELKDVDAGTPPTESGPTGAAK